MIFVAGCFSIMKDREIVTRERRGWERLIGRKYEEEEGGDGKDYDQEEKETEKEGTARTQKRERREKKQQIGNGRGKRERKEGNAGDIKHEGEEKEDTIKR